jgi:hypothetical protein
MEEGFDLNSLCSKQRGGVMMIAIWQAIGLRFSILFYIQAKISEYKSYISRGRVGVVNVDEDDFNKEEF